jgi:hypothetical protein
MNKLKILLPIIVLALLALAFGLGQQMANKPTTDSPTTDKPLTVTSNAPTLENITNLEVELDNNCRPSSSMESYTAKKTDTTDLETTIKFFDVTKPLNTYSTTAPQTAYNKAVAILEGKESMIQESATNTYDTIQAIFSYNDKEPGCSGPLTPFKDVTNDPELKISNVDIYKSNLYIGEQGYGIGYQALAKKGNHMILINVGSEPFGIDKNLIKENCNKLFAKMNEQAKCLGDEYLKTDQAALYTKIKKGLEAVKIKM